MVAVKGEASIDRARITVMRRFCRGVKVVYGVIILGVSLEAS